MRLKKLLTFVSFIIINLSSINLSYSIEPDIFVQSTVNRASQVLSDNITKIKKIEKLKDIAKETVDINGIGFYTLGLYRKNITNDQKKRVYCSF
jgi:phospholipid transport system substrate-binding protein